VPPAVQQRTEQRIRAHAEARYAGRYARLDIRFRGALCYIDAYTESDEPSANLLAALRETREQFLERLRATPMHLCRLRYFGDEEQWSLAFFTYSNERYTPCAFPNGTFYGTPEEALEIGAVYLHGG
jgi:hypothetical protein